MCPIRSLSKICCWIVFTSHVVLEFQFFWYCFLWILSYGIALEPFYVWLQLFLCHVSFLVHFLIIDSLKSFFSFLCGPMWNIGPFISFSKKSICPLPLLGVGKKSKVEPPFKCGSNFSKLSLFFCFFTHDMNFCSLSLHLKLFVNIQVSLSFHSGSHALIRLSFFIQGL